MAGPNLTGAPKTTDYLLGRGRLYAAELDANNKPKAYRDLGNCPEFALAMESETLQHLSSRGGLKTVDKEVTIRQSGTTTFRLDELSHDNMALFLSGDMSTHTNSAIAGWTVFAMVAASAGLLEGGRWYDLQNSTNVRAYDIDSSKLTIADTTDVAFVKDTDYTLDATWGRIFLIPTSAKVIAAVAADRGLKATLTADATAKVVEQVKGLTQTNKIVALKFISVNPANNDEETEFEFHKVTLKADGDLGLISDDFTTAGFTGAAESVEGVGSLTIRNLAA